MLPPCCFSVTERLHYLASNNAPVTNLCGSNTLFEIAPFAFAKEHHDAASTDSISDHVDYKGGFYLNDDTGNCSLKMNARMQTKYLFEAVHDGGEDRDLDNMFKAHGFSSTGGLYVESIQPVFRYGVINPKGGKNFTQEIFGGISVYFANHNLKWQTEVGDKFYKDANDDEDDPSDAIVATQLQLGFQVEYSRQIVAMNFYTGGGQF